MKINIMKIDGEWESGLVLDWHVDHSEFLGHNQYGHPEYNTVRTEVGESLYQLKYRSDLTQIDSLAKTMADAVMPIFHLFHLLSQHPHQNQGRLNHSQSWPKKLLNYSKSHFLRVFC